MNRFHLYRQGVACPYLRGMNAAAGYLALGLAADALEEIEWIESERPPTALLELKKEIVVALRDWERMKACCEKLCRSMPWAPGWAVQLSHAVRLCGSPQEALRVLLGSGGATLPRQPGHALQRRAAGRGAGKSTGGPPAFGPSL